MTRLVPTAAYHEAMDVHYDPAATQDEVDASGEVMAAYREQREPSFDSLLILQGLAHKRQAQDRWGK
jgi:hypothetical protein